MNIAEWLFASMGKLGDAGVDSPRRDALVLLEDVIKKDRAFVTSHPEHELKTSDLEKLKKLVEKRVKREPLAYIRGRAWFYGRFFDVSPDVMIPRPESEAFVELLKELYSGKQQAVSGKPRIVDVGTGSGCLAVTAKLEVPGAEVSATDISNKSLAIAKKNAQNHKVKINFHQGNLLEPLRNMEYGIWNMVLVVNLPYVPAGMITSPEITQEPAEALFSGADGLDHYREFFQQIAASAPTGQADNQPNRAQYLLTESLETQHPEMIKLATNAGYRHTKTDVLVQLFQRN